MLVRFVIGKQTSSCEDDKDSNEPSASPRASGSPRAKKKGKAKLGVNGIASEQTAESDQLEVSVAMPPRPEWRRAKSGILGLEEDRIEIQERVDATLANWHISEGAKRVIGRTDGPLSGLVRSAFFRVLVNLCAD